MGEDIKLEIVEHYIYKIVETLEEVGEESIYTICEGNKIIRIRLLKILRQNTAALHDLKPREATDTGMNQS